MKKKTESGELVIEASFIVTFAVMLITVMICIGMAMYHQTLVTVMAHQTASHIATVYGNKLKDPFTGYVDPDKVYQSVTYSNMKNDAYLNVLEQKAMIYAKYRLRSSRILAEESSTVDVEIIRKPNELLKNQIKVVIENSYDVPLVGFFVDNSLITFSSSGTADCADILEYMPGIDAIGDPLNSPIQVFPDSDPCMVTFYRDTTTSMFYKAEPVLRGKSMLTSNKDTHCTMPEDPQYDGMRFLGWRTSSGAGFTVMTQVNTDTAVFGAWECTVKLDPCGGTVFPDTATTEYMDTVELPVPVREGYAFEGWFAEAGGTGERYYSNVTQIKGNITLYAHWRCLHDFDAALVRPGTCTERSLWKYTCKRADCGYSYEEEGEIQKDNHNWKNVKEFYDGGCFEGRVCQRCGLREGIYTAKATCAHNANPDDWEWWGHCGMKHEYTPGMTFYENRAHTPGTHFTKYFWCIVCLKCGGFYYGNDDEDMSEYSRYKYCGRCFPTPSAMNDYRTNAHYHG